MTRWLVTTAVSLQIAMAALGAGSGAGTLAAQQVVVASRGPRFFSKPSPKTAPVEIDVRSSELLRRLVSLDLDRVTVGTLLAAIERQTGIEFIYSRNVIAVDRPVWLRAERITVAGALTEILIDGDIDVLLQGNHLALVERPPLNTRQRGTVVGRVTDARAGQPIAAAEILLQGTRRHVSTNSTGRYRLEAVDTGTYTLIVRRLGYAKQSRRVTVREEREDTVDLALEPAAARMDELVTTATGQQRRRDLGNAITTINADSVLRTAPIRNLTDLLEGRVTGLTVQHTSGAPGDPSRLRLRGLNSVLRSNDPVVVVDGVRLYAAQSDARSGNLTNAALGVSGAVPTPVNAQPSPLAAPSPLDQIDPNTIEKIEVFKGPSAATLYGADAANGVIVITTKKGRPGPARWNAALTQGITNTPGKYPTGYYRWGHTRLNNTSMFCPLAVLIPCVQDSLVRYQALNDPDFTVLGRGHRTDGSLTISGGSQALQYSFTGTYGDETGLLALPAFESDRYQALVGRAAPGWMRRPHQFMNWSVSSRVTAQLGAAADVTLSTMLTRAEQSRTSLERQLKTLAGTYVDRINGVYYVPNQAYAIQGTSDFLQNFYQRATASAFNFTTGLQSNWRPRPWFNGIGQVGLNIIPRQDELLLPVGPQGFGSDSGSLVRGTGRSLVSTVNLQGTARKLLGRGFRFETSAGVNLTTQHTDDVTSSAVGLVPGTSSLSGARRFTVVDAGTNSSVFGYYVEPRVTGDRLSLSTGLRLDGGSAYGARLTRSGGGLFGLLSLPKLNGSWVISEEPWFPFNSVFNSLRLRGAYGQSQVQPGPADRLRLYQRTAAADEHFVLTNPGNTQLRPERDGELEGGFDADLLDNRLSLEVTGYRKTARDALLPVTLPGSLGGGQVIKNIGTIRNTGMDVTARVTPLRASAATWNLEFSYSRNTNLLVELGKGVTPNREDGFVAGYPVGGRWAQPIVAYADQNGNGVLDGPSEIQLGDSAVYVGRLLPKYQTALHTNLALFDGALGVHAGFTYDAGASQINQTARDNWVLARALVDPSAPLGEQAAVLASQFGTTYGVTQQVSTFRFQSLSVNYRAPAAITRVVRAQQLSIAAQGSNLGLHSTYRGKDPNVNSWQPGESVVDTGQLPQPRTWQLSVYVTY